jgi:dihydroorotase/allantoinase
MAEHSAATEDRPSETESYDLVVAGGTVVTPRDRYRADVGVRNGRIATLSDDLSTVAATEQVTVDGQYVLPGAIDGHMHLWEPGFVADHDFRDGTRSAAAGGVTTVVCQPLTTPEVQTVDIFEEKREIGERTSYIDFGLHAGVGADNMDELEALWEAGCTAFKIFMAGEDDPDRTRDGRSAIVGGLTTGELQEAIERIGSFGGTALFHAENQAMVDHATKRVKAAGRTDPMALADSRPPESETMAIQQALFFLRRTDCRGVFLHTTVPEGVEMVREARQDGHDVWVETGPHILNLTHEELTERGPWVTFVPPNRDRGRVDRLWEQLDAGDIHLLASDHGAVDPDLKEGGMENIWDSVPGLPGAETLVPMMVDGVGEGKIDLEHLAAAFGEHPAKAYGLYPRKGAITVGSDADFTVVDLDRTRTISADDLHMSCGWTPFEGYELTGDVTHTIVGGEVVAREGEVLGDPGDGRFVPRLDAVE